MQGLAYLFMLVIAFIRLYFFIGKTIVWIKIRQAFKFKEIFSDHQKVTSYAIDPVIDITPKKSPCFSRNSCTIITTTSLTQENKRDTPQIMKNRYLGHS